MTAQNDAHEHGTGVHVHGQTDRKLNLQLCVWPVFMGAQTDTHKHGWGGVHGYEFAGAVSTSMLTVYEHGPGSVDEAPVNMGSKHKLHVDLN